jgi:hypothetical protein
MAQIFSQYLTKTAIFLKLPAEVRLSIDELEEYSGDWKVG